MEVIFLTFLIYEVMHTLFFISLCYCSSLSVYEDFYGFKMYLENRNYSVLKWASFVIYVVMHTLFFIFNLLFYLIGFQIRYALQIFAYKSQFVKIFTYLVLLTLLLHSLLYLKLRATQLVLKAHKEAVNSLSGNGSSKLGTVATVVAAANSTAAEASKEIESAMQIAMKNALGAMLNRPLDGPMDDLAIMKVSIYHYVVV